MALIWLEGFKYLDYDALTQKYTNTDDTTAFNFVSGRDGRGAIEIYHRNFYDNPYASAGIFWGTTNKTVLFVGFAFKVANTAGRTIPLVGFIDNIETQCCVAISPTGQIQVWRGSSGGAALGTQIGTGPYVNVDIWNYLEFKVDFGGGSYAVRINAVTVVSASADVTNTANAYANAVMLNIPVNYGGSVIGNQGKVTYGDFYILDDNPSGATDFLGDLRVDHVLPDAVGTYAQFTPSAGSNFQCVDETAPNETDYVESSTVGQIDSYNFPNQTFTGTVVGIQVTTFGYKTDGGDRFINHFCKSNTTEAVSSAIPLTEVVGCQTSMFEKDPHVSAAWTVTTGNAAEFGQKIAS